MHKVLATLVQGGGLDLFIAAHFPPSMKAYGSCSASGVSLCVSE